jgi:hypothetical protein
MTKISKAILISLTSLLVGACGEAERTYDCVKICDKYAKCYDDELDKTDCVDSCEANGDLDADFAAKADDCEACIDDSSCAEASLDCSDECTTVIAESIN